MEGIQSDLATQLLNSPDAAVAAAAKRIFFEAAPTPPQQQQQQQQQQQPSSNHLEKIGSNISADVKKAATTVATMMDPNKRSHLMNTVTSTTCHPTLETTVETPVVVTQTTPTKPQSKSNAITTQSDTKSPEKQSITQDRLKRSRERNKMHARKTRQRKKEHMTQLESTVDALKEEQIGLKLRIKEKNTANILVDMLSSSSTRGSKINSSSNDQLVDPKLDALLKRKEEDIPDASKIPDLPALILPGNHNKRRKLDTSLSKAATKLAQAPVTINVQQEYPNDGIDYELLGKDRTSCTPEELDKIRKERNRMHAKRTRDRKRIFMEEMEKIIKQLETENELLQNHLSEISTDSATAASLSSSGRVTPSDTKQLSHDIQTNTAAETQNNMESRNLISCGSSTVSASPSPSLNLPNSNPNPPTLQLSRSQQQVPLSITTTSNAGGDMHC